MLDDLSDAQTVALSLAILGVVLVVAWIIRRRVGLLHRLFIPASVVGGFAVLLLGRRGSASGPTATGCSHRP